VTTRCAWVPPADALYVAYHDEEWGVPERDDRALFELLNLEGAQAGLSWSTILRKREGYRRAFAGWDIQRIARFGQDDVERLLGDAGIVRNRAKIEAAIANARAATEVDDLAKLIWSFAPPADRPAPRSFADVPAVTAESKALAKELKRRRFRFIGPTTAYAAMQACGLVNDHLEGCCAR
jgi:DNA-3-methyladenine glycosylase I